MAEAAEFYEKHPAALKLRELQTLVEIAKEKNLIVVSGQTSPLGEVVGLTTGLAQYRKAGSE